MIYADFRIKIIAVFKPGRIIADFLALAITSHQFPFRFLHIDVEGDDIPETDDIRILFFVAIRSFHYKTARYTIFQFYTEGIALTESHCGVEAVQCCSVFFPVGNLLFDLFYRGMAAIIKPWGEKL